MENNSFSNKIEDYQISNLLGKGGFASVYKARCRLTGIQVAIKMIDKKMLQSSGMKNRVQQEIAIHSRLRHPSILQLYTFFEDAQYVYLVLELCDNGELQHYIKQKELSEFEVSNIMRQVVEGIKYLHSYSILHRDISLSNLLLTRDMHVKIADFGLATQLTRPDEKHMTMCGTPNFISPEVASRSSHGLAVDIWGLGCLLYTLLVGKPPFDTQNVKSTLTRVVMDTYSIPAHLSPEAKDLINALLQKNPKDRIGLDQILDHPFLKRSLVMMTHDSGIHTMSSRRDSAFNDGSYSSNFYSRKASSDCCPSTVPYITSRLAHSLEQVNFYDQHCHNEQNQALCVENTDQNTSCSCRSVCKGHANKYSYQEICPSASQCNGSCHHLNDPGGGHAPQSVLTNLPFKSPSLPLESTNCLTGNGKSASPYSMPSYAMSHTSQTRPGDTFKKENLEQLCSLRLLPTKHQTNNAVLSILNDGEVVIEFIKRRGSKKKEMVCEVMRISPDGARVILYEPESGRGCPAGQEPTPVPLAGADHIFSINNLPEKHWKKYMYAHKFVNLVKAKTPKVTYYSDKAKGLLMENLKDFEASFYEGGKVTYSTTGGVTLIDSSGRKYDFKNSDDCHSLTGTLELMWNHSHELFDHCLLLEKTISLMNSNDFPIIVGRRPISVVNYSDKENHSRTAPAFMASFNSTAPGTSFGTNVSRERKVVVPGVGTATQLSNGEIKVKYHDGSQLWVDGKHIRHQYHRDGQIVRYTVGGSLPEDILEKFQHMLKAIEQFRPSPLSTKKIHNFR
ncbi:serine/threonine-protein kinase PLK4 [Cylas formicarius]|uniref:serine/threonine-protein kinase PLK4 n=1 Tax=Cylas formicarius TaxID=197179 RepID=UPI00295862CD|nr:serine/threonine-protein kinase PLK4 [Cylas formicarius]